MADREPALQPTAEPVADKEITTAPEVNSGSETHDVEHAGVAPRPTGWQYKPLGLGPLGLGYYASPSFQLVMVSFVCFLCPGMFNAINGIGGAGQVDATTADQANIALYCFFCVVGFVAGSIVNRIGVKITLGIGGAGYCLYVASFLCYNHTGNRGFTVFAGAFLGFCAALLWTAQGAIMMSYPFEADKGKYIATFWIIFNLGGVIGSLVSDFQLRTTAARFLTSLVQIPLGQNINNSSGTVTDGTYAGFIVLMFLGAVLATLLTNAGNVVRKDGSRVIVMKNPSWKSELFGLFEVLVTDWYIILLFPMFFASNFFYTYQFQDVNLARFTVRTRSLNSVLYWGMQMVGAAVFGAALDIKAIGRPMRAKAALVALFAITMGRTSQLADETLLLTRTVIWGGGYAFQSQYDRASNPGSKDTPISVLLDWTTPGYGGPMVLYMFYGFYDGKHSNHQPTGRLSTDLCFKLPGRPVSTGSWAPSPTTAASWPTSPASTSPSSRPAASSRPPSISRSRRT